MGPNLFVSTHRLFLALTFCTAEQTQERTTSMSFDTNMAHTLPPCLTRQDGNTQYAFENLFSDVSEESGPIPDTVFSGFVPQVSTPSAIRYSPSTCYQDTDQADDDEEELDKKPKAYNKGFYDKGFNSKGKEQSKGKGDPELWHRIFGKIDHPEIIGEIVHTWQCGFLNGPENRRNKHIRCVLRQKLQELLLRLEKEHSEVRDATGDFTAYITAAVDGQVFDEEDTKRLADLRCKHHNLRYIGGELYARGKDIKVFKQAIDHLSPKKVRFVKDTKFSPAPRKKPRIFKQEIEEGTALFNEEEDFESFFGAETESDIGF